MKIIYIGSAHPLRGGLAAFNEHLSKKLQDLGHDVTLYSFSLQYPSVLFPGKTQYTTEPAPEGLRIRTIINSINPLNWIKVGKMIREEKPDLILLKYWLPFMGPCFGTILRIANKNKHSRVICILDNLIPHEKRPGDLAFTKYFIKPVDAFLAMSRKVLADVQVLSDKPSVYTPHPIYDNYGEGVPQSEARKQLGLDPNEKYLLFFGFIRKYKGLDLLLEAMADRRIQAAGIKLIVAGEYYEDKAPYEEIISKNKLEASVKLFTDFIPNEQVKYFFSAADLVVQPYKSATQSGITQIAYSFEKPMVITNVGGLAEAVPDGKVGFVAEPNPGSIADAILKFFQPDSIPDLKENLQKEKAKYSWDAFIQVLMSLK
jgi:glycosyltransferase involved in cell wall biosynthesis